MRCANLAVVVAITKTELPNNRQLRIIRLGFGCFNL